MNLPPIVGDQIETISVADWRSLVARVVEKHRLRFKSPTAVVQQLNPPLKPHVLRGRWVVACPYCDGVTLYAYGSATWYCLEPACPRPHGWSLLAVEEPDATEARRGEWLLLHRVEVATDRRTGDPVHGLDGALVTAAKYDNRNWNFHTGETAADLARENTEHGMRAPPVHAEFALNQPIPSSALTHTPQDGLVVRGAARVPPGGPPAERPAGPVAPRVTHYGPDGTAVTEPRRGGA